MASCARDRTRPCVSCAAGSRGERLAHVENARRREQEHEDAEDHPDEEIGRRETGRERKGARGPRGPRAGVVLTVPCPPGRRWRASRSTRRGRVGEKKWRADLGVDGRGTADGNVRLQARVELFADSLHLHELLGPGEGLFLATLDDALGDLRADPGQVCELRRRGGVDVDLPGGLLFVPEARADSPVQISTARQAARTRDAVMSFSFDRDRSKLQSIFLVVFVLIGFPDDQAFSIGTSFRRRAEIARGRAGRRARGRSRRSGTG